MLERLFNDLLSIEIKDRLVWRVLLNIGLLFGGDPKGWNDIDLLN